MIYVTGRLLELLGLASDIRVEVPTKLTAAGTPPAPFPGVSVMWTLSASVWTVILTTASRFHQHSERMRSGAPRVEAAKATR